MKTYKRLLDCSRALLGVALIVCGAQLLRAATVKALNPFGLLPPKAEGVFTETDPDGDGKFSPPPEASLKPYERVRAARNLSAPIIRLSMDVYNWMHLVNPTLYADAASTRLAQLDQYKSYVNAGCRIQLNVNWGGPVSDYTVTDTGNQGPFPGPTDLGNYKAGLALMLEALRSYTSENGFNGTPELIAVENEEMNLAEMDKTASGWPTPQTNVANYLTEIKYATDVVKNGYHAGSINYPASGSVPAIGMTNGGIVERYMELLVWDWYKNGGGPGSSATFGSNYMDSVIYDSSTDTLTSGGVSRLAAAYWFMNGVGGSTGYTNTTPAIDYINFHWYGPRPGEGTTTAGTSVQALNDYQAVLGHLLPGKPAITNELGSQVSNRADATASVAAVQAILGQVHDVMGLPYIVWYSGNKDDFYTGTAPNVRYVSLTDADGNLHYTDATTHLPDPTTTNAEGAAFYNFITDPARFGGEAWTAQGDTTEYGPYAFPGARTGWWCSSASGIAVVGNALKLTTNSGARHALVYTRSSAAAATKLTTVGDVVRVDFATQLTGTIAATDSVYFGLFNSNGATRVSADGHNGAADDTTAFRTYDGYRVELLPAAGTGASSITFGARAPVTTGSQALLCNDTAYPSGNLFGASGQLGTLSAGTPYYCTMTIERTALRTVLVSLSVYSNSARTATVFTNSASYDVDGSLYPDGNEKPYDFDTFALGVPGDTLSAVYLDDVAVTYSPSPTPKTAPVATSSMVEAVLGTSRSASIDLTGGSVPATIEWNAVNLTAPVRGPNTLASTGTGQDSWTISTAGTYTAVVTNPAGQSFVGPFFLWNQTAVNGITGSSSSFSSGTYTVTAGTGNIGGTSDKFYWLKQPALSHQTTPATSTTVIARVSYADTTNGNSAGVMIRGLPSDELAKNLFVGVTRGASSYSITAQYRTGSGGGTSTLGSPISLGGTGTAWVKIVWQAGGAFDVYGNTSTAATQPATGWTLIGSTTAVAITNNTVSLGLAAAHGGASGTLTASFSGVSVTAP